ncbi:hypothetical protein OMAG_002685, partial [Candidatus Omnitrophus magneticus]
KKIYKTLALLLEKFPYFSLPYDKTRETAAGRSRQAIKQAWEQSAHQQHIRQ